MSSLDMNEILGEAQRLNDQQAQGEGNNFLSNFVKMPEGAGHVTVRILPPAKAGKFDRPSSPFKVGTRVHKVNNKSLHCPNVQQKMDGGAVRWVGDCPICGYYRSLWKRAEKLPQNTDERKKLEDKARAIKPIERYYFNVIVRSQFNPETNTVETNIGPKILSVGVTLYGTIIRGIAGNKELDEPGYGDVTDITGKTGRDFKIIKTIKKGNTGGQFAGYEGSKFLEPSPLGTPEQVKEWLENLHDLVALRQLKPNEELEKQLMIHNGVIPDDGGDGNDYSKYETPQGGVGGDEDVHVERQAPVQAQAQTQPRKAAPKPSQPAPAPVTSAVEEEAAGGGDENVPEPDFMEQLRSMK
jgi:hypothetical protein